MKVSGFTIVRNAVKFDYPVVESIKSVLPLCDEFIVLVGNSEDETIELIKSIESSKIIIKNSVWDDSLREGGRVLAEETNKAFKLIAPDSDWAIYIQADEVIHEKYYDNIRQAMSKYCQDMTVEGLLFKYTHFYANYNYVGDSRSWYRQEVRIVRNNKSIESYKDAQGFRIKGRKLMVKPIDAYIYHYGWVKNPYYQQQKQKEFHKMWHSDQWVQQNIKSGDMFDYSNIDSLSHFEGKHPEVMLERIKNTNWEFEFDTKKKNMKFVRKLLYYIEKFTGVRLFEYRNYTIKN